MARTKDDVQKAAAAATTSSDAPKRRGRPAKDVTSADTGAGVKKPAAKRGRPAGATSTKAQAPKKTAAADGAPKKRGRPAGSTNKAKTGATKTKKPSSSAAAKRLRDFLPAISTEENTSGADRRRAKMAGNKLEMLPDVKKAVNANDGRRKNKGAPKGVTPRKTASSPLKRDSPAIGRASPAGIADSTGKNGDAGKENTSQTPLFGSFKSMFG